MSRDLAVDPPTPIPYAAENRDELRSAGIGRIDLTLRIERISRIPREVTGRHSEHLERRVGVDGTRIVDEIAAGHIRVIA